MFEHYLIHIRIIFRSNGSFFSQQAGALITETGGAYEVNPPFLEEHMFAAVLTLEHWLATCTQPLTFVVFVPQWNDSPYYELLSRSTYTQHTANHAKGTHTYVRGFQHVDETPKAGIGYAHSSVFYLQNNAATLSAPISDAHVAAVDAAMRNRTW